MKFNVVNIIESCPDRIINGDNQGVLRDMNLVISVWTSSSNAFFYRGYALFNLKRFKQAIIDFKKVLEFDNDSMKANAFLSYSYCSLNDHEKGLFYANRCIDIDPGWYEYMQRAAIYKAIGESEKEKADRNKAWSFGHDFIY